MSRRTLVYLLAPPILLGAWATLYLVWGHSLSRRTGARVDVGPVTVVERTMPERVPLDPALLERLQPLEASRREWMQAMAAERQEMIKQAYALLDELEQELPPE